MALTLQEMNQKAVAELTEVIERIDNGQVESLLKKLASANRIVLYGVGREGLMMKALAMRLYHMGLDAHVAADMTTPPVGRGDLMIVSAGPGYFSTVNALLGVAREAGAEVACFTAQPEGEVPMKADLTVVLPAQTMAVDTISPSSFLPMGSLYEGAQYLFYEYLVLMLAEHLEIKPDEMRSRHTNLE